MRTRLTVILILLNLVAFFWIYRLERQNDPSDRIGSGAEILEPGAEIQSITLSRTNGSTFTVQRDGTQWYIRKPIDWPANSYAIQRLITQIEFLETEVSFSLEGTGQTLDDYGLSNPALTLTIETNAGTHSLKIGDSTDIGNRVYLLNPRNNYVMVAGGELLASLNIEIEDLRRPDIFDIPIFEIRGLTFKVSTTENTTLGIAPEQEQRTTLRLTREGDTWMFETPITAEASTARMKRLLNRICSLQGLRFQPATQLDNATHGLDNPRMRLSLQGNGRQQTLYIGNLDPSAPSNNPHAFAKLESSPTIFSIPMLTFDVLAAKWETFREPRFVKFDPIDVNAIDISQGNTSITLQKLETGAWKVIKDTGNEALDNMPADMLVVEKLMTELLTLQALGFVSDAPSESDLKLWGFTDPQRTVRLRHAKGETILYIGNVISQGPGDTQTDNVLLYATTKEDSSIYAVSPSILRETSLAALHYRDRTLFTVPERGVISGLKVIDLKTEQPLFNITLQNIEKDWSEALKGTEPETADALISLAREFRRLNVKSYLKNEYNETTKLDEETEVPWTHAVEVTILLPGSDNSTTRTHRFTFSDRLGGDLMLGGSSEHKLTFLANKELMQALHTLTSDRPTPPEHAPDYVEPQPGEDDPYADQPAPELAPEDTPPTE